MLVVSRGLHAFHPYTKIIFSRHIKLFGSIDAEAYGGYVWMRIKYTRAMIKLLRTTTIQRIKKSEENL